MKISNASVVGLVLFVLAGCEHHTPEFSSQAMQRIQHDYPGMTSKCLQKLRYGQEIPNQVDECFEMTREQRWQGLWRYNFEGSIFCSAPAQRCSEVDPAKEIWLSFANDRAPIEGPPNGKLYKIEFLGRRTLKAGGYGHMGIFEHEMVIDRVISIAPVPD